VKLAIVHDWIIGIGGAERVLIALHRLWPDAPIYTLLYRPGTVRAFLPGATIIASGLQHIPGASRIYPWLAPFMPSATESLDLSNYDTVLSSSVLFSKGIIVRPGTRHLCYCYSPSRMLWDRNASYERRGIASRLYRHALRSWDFAAAQRPDELIAISHTAARRIEKYYRRSAVVVPPPTHVPEIVENIQSEPYFLVVARLVPHKMLDEVLAAFAKLRQKLIIVGDGPLKRHVRRKATKNVQLVGAVSDAELSRLYAACSAVILPNEEDWGLTAVEAMARGKPVLALRRGGATETVIEGVTGEFFDDPIPEAIGEGVHRIVATLDRYDPAYIRTHALQFGEEQFALRMRTLVERN
jgi:glycosyltransferase involved in cell wall biosynthesis